MMHQKQKYG